MSQIRVDEITNETGDGPPDFPFGAVGIEGVPTGAFMFFTMNTAPTGWLKANGAAISRTTYSALFDAIGTTFGAGDGSTTFELPDLRGEFPRGWDDGRGVDSGRSFGTAQLDQMQKITANMRFRDTSANDFGVIKSSSGAFSSSIGGSGAQTSGSGGGSNLSFDSANSPDARTSTSTDGETRPRNIALLACIKY